VGDGVLAYFSFPVATENDPERAVRAALDIVHHIGDLASPAPERLQVRIGIATGKVIVSDLFAGEQTDKNSIIGQTPNLAARLQGYADAGGIVVAEATHRRIEHLFVSADLGLLEIKGLAERHRAWQVLRARQPGGISMNPRREWFTPIVGRATELDILTRRWRDARAGEGGAVFITGEPGIGKSRLVETFAERVVAAGNAIRLSASPFDVDSPLQPFIVWLRGEAGLEPAQTTEERLARLKAILPEALRATEVDVSVLMTLIDADPGSELPVPPALLRKRTLSILLDHILALAGQSALCLCVEDLHWLDPTSLELLQRLIVRLQGQRLLLLLTARNNFEAPWGLRPEVAALPLERLTGGDVAEMLGSLFQDRGLPEALLRQIIRKSDGIPLFVEEVTRGLLQRERLPDAAATIDEPEPEIPASLHESLMARLDRLGVAKEIAQIAAVIGRSVRREVLAKVADMRLGALEEPLATLADGGVMFREGGENNEVYTFAHALLRDAAYDSLLRDRRQTLHLRTAQALKGLDPSGVEQQPEVLALHLTEGGRADEAAPWWQEAARRSLHRSALTEATRLLRRGLAGLERLPGVEANLQLRLQLDALLGPALISLKGLGASETQELYANAHELCENVTEGPAHFPIYWGWWRVSRDYRASRDRAEMLLRHARRRGDPELLVEGHHCSWASHYCSGSLATCCEHIEAGLKIYDEHDFSHHASLYGNHDAKVCAHGERAQVYWMQGRLAEALIEERQSVAWAERIDHLGSIAHARDMRLLHRIYRRDYASVLELAGDFTGFASDRDLAAARAVGVIYRGWAMAMQGDVARGLAMLEEGLAEQREIGSQEDAPVHVGLWVEALMKAGRAETAVEELAKACEEFDRIGLQFWMPELLRLRGKATLAGDPRAADTALRYFDQAVDLATTQGATMLRVRAAVSAGWLQWELGRPAEARQTVAAAMAALPVDCDGVDVAAARTLAAQSRKHESGVKLRSDVVS
jgi:predicted ATPase